MYIDNYSGATPSTVISQKYKSHCRLMVNSDQMEEYTSILQELTGENISFILISIDLKITSRRCAIHNL